MAEENQKDLLLDPAAFEQEWIKIAELTIQELMAHPEIEKIKQSVRSKGHVGLDDRNEFINIVNEVKYQVIHKKFGDENSEGYQEFVRAWQRWHKLKATTMNKPENMFEDNIHHLLFGSTPDPDAFLKDFDVNQDL